MINDQYVPQKAIFYFQVIVFLLFAIIITVICACGALIGGVKYWTDGWQLARRANDNGQCNSNTNVCKCNGNNLIPFEGTVTFIINLFYLKRETKLF